MPAVRAVAALGLLAAAAVAQAPSAWSELQLPGGLGNAQVTSLGKLVVVRDGGAVHAWSAATRSWHHTTAGPSAALRLTNDCLLLQDQGLWQALGSYGDGFRPLAVSAQAQLVNPLGQDNDSAWLVRDGGQLHAFSGFVGAWTSRPIGANAAVAVRRHTGLLADGGALGGYDAFTGTWHDLAVAAPPAQLSVDGTAGLAIGPTLVHGFSALHRRWSTAPALPAAQFDRNDDWALFHDAQQLLAYSGPQGRFELAPLGATAVVASEDLFAVVATGLGLVPYSAIRGSFGPLLGPSGNPVASEAACAVVVDGPLVLGYSPLRNSVQALPITASREDAAGVVGAAIEAATGLPWLFSALTGQWYAPPPGALPQPPLLTATGALLATAGGAVGFAARHGSFAPLAANQPVLLGNPNSAAAGAYDAAAVHAFDARLGRWVSAPRHGSGPVVAQAWRTSLCLVDGPVAHGFGSQSGRLEPLALAEPLQSLRANSESLRLQGQTRVWCHAATGWLSSLGQFPEFRRVVPAGTPVRLRLPVGAGAALLAGGALAAAPAAVPGLGDLWLAPGALATALLLPLPGSALAAADLPTPADPALVGLEWGFQALVLPPAGAAFLTELATALLV